MEISLQKTFKLKFKLISSFQMFCCWTNQTKLFNVTWRNFDFLCLREEELMILLRGAGDPPPNLDIQSECHKIL